MGTVDVVDGCRRERCAVPPTSVYARGDIATKFYQGIHEDIEMQSPTGELYPVVRCVRGLSSIKEVSARYTTYVLSYTPAPVKARQEFKL